MSKDEEIKLLKAANAALRQQVKSLEEKVLSLLQVVEKQLIKKDSRNSHNSPSQDKSKPKRNQSLRKKSTRKSGGQKGHKGTTLKMSLTPDEVRDLKSDYCSACGEDLRLSKFTLASKRQEVVLPPIVPLFIEYRQWSSVCKCGHCQKASYPNHIKAPIQFGSDIIALVSYLNVFQYVPYARLKLLFKDVFNLSISEGSIQNLLNKGANKAQPIYEQILEQIKKATYVGSDETGAKVNGEKWWIWVWQNVKNTFIKPSKSRGFNTIESTFPDGLPNATIGSDRWAAQLKMGSKNKQLCFPHLLRDLNFLIESEKNEWASHFKSLLKEALALRKSELYNKKSYPKVSFETYQLEHRLNRLLIRFIDKEKFAKTFTFQKSMIKNRNYLVLDRKLIYR